MGKGKLEQHNVYVSRKVDGKYMYRLLFHVEFKGALKMEDRKKQDRNLQNQYFGKYRTGKCRTGF